MSPIGEAIRDMPGFSFSGVVRFFEDIIWIQNKRIISFEMMRELRLHACLSKSEFTDVGVSDRMRAGF